MSLGVLKRAFPQTPDGGDRFVVGGAQFWYTIPGVTQSTVDQTMGTQYHARGHPFPVGRATLFSNIGSRLTNVPTAGTLERWGIYPDDGFGRPGAPLLFDTGTVDISAGNAWFQRPLNRVLGLGLWHVFQMVNNVGATVPTFTSCDGNYNPGWVGWDAESITGSRMWSLYIGASQGFPVDPASVLNYHNASPLIYLQAA